MIRVMKTKLTSLRYDLISVYNLEIIKQQQRQIDSQNERIERLERMIEEMQAYIGQK